MLVVIAFSARLPALAGWWKGSSDVSAVGGHAGLSGQVPGHPIAVADIRGSYFYRPPRPGRACGTLQSCPGDAGTHDEALGGGVYVKAVRLVAPRGAVPVALLHGGAGLTGASYESGLDGSPGWQIGLLRSGYDTLVVDWNAGGRSPWPRDANHGRAQPRLPSPAALWELFRLGPPGSFSPDPALRTSYPGSRFPGELFDVFLAQVQPSFRGYTRYRPAAFDALLSGAGPLGLVSYSAAGPLAAAASLRQPAQVRAHVLVEPSGAPDPAAADLRPLARVPHLFLWGDYLDSQAGKWRELHRSARCYADALQAMGADVTWIDLPVRGISGNTHLLMFDHNAPQLLDIIATWLDGHLDCT
jgi:hypothetical protein